MLQAVNHHIVRTVVTSPASSKFCSKKKFPFSKMFVDQHFLLKTKSFHLHKVVNRLLNLWGDENFALSLKNLAIKFVVLFTVSVVAKFNQSEDARSQSRATLSCCFLQKSVFVTSVLVPPTGFVVFFSFFR